MLININDNLLLYKELASIGLFVAGFDVEMNVQLLEPDTNNLVPLVLSAHSQPLSSDACQSLKQAITTDQWDKYCEARNEPIRQQRNTRYRNETDPMRLSLDDKHEIGSEEWLAGLTNWKAAKQAIRESLSYEVE